MLAPLFVRALAAMNLVFVLYFLVEATSPVLGGASQPVALEVSVAYDLLLPATGVMVFAVLYTWVIFAMSPTEVELDEGGAQFAFSSSTGTMLCRRLFSGAPAHIMKSSVTWVSSQGFLYRLSRRVRIEHGVAEPCDILGLSDELREMLMLTLSPPSAQ